VKHAIVIIGFAGLLLQPQFARASVENSYPQRLGDPFDAIPLMQWDEPDVMAEQVPAGTPTPPPVVPVPPAPTTPVAPAPITAAPVAPLPNTAAPLPGDTPDVNDPAAPATDGATDEDFSLGDIPVVETIELSTDKAKKALDTYVLVRDKYKDAELENYENLQDFVDQSPQGKAFETDVKAAGFPNVIEWNTTITTLSFAYDNSINDQTKDIQQQITELNADTTMATDMRDRMITALNAMIPSDNNKKVLDELKADPAYAEKLKLLETETE
jgi:hypothetical protein